LLAILGKSGCGKTTLLKLLAGFEQPDHGDIRIHGVSQHNKTCAERQLGIVFQDYALFPHYTVAQNIGYPLKIKKHPHPAVKVAEMIELVGLTGLDQKYPNQLSGGQKQRVALARALVFEPSALLLDEPLSALDASLREEMRREITNIRSNLNVTTILITHDQEEAMTMADKVAVMSDGRIIQCDTPETLYHQPATQEIAQFVGKTNLLTGEVVSPESVKTPIGLLYTRPHPYPAGEAVTLVIRPELVRQILPTMASEQNNCFAIGQIVQRRFLGATTEYTVQIGEKQLKFEIPVLPETLKYIFFPQQTIHVLHGAAS
jgi:putative spermidine/putrescine transport system ATP-binding protein